MSLRRAVVSVLAIATCGACGSSTPAAAPANGAHASGTSASPSSSPSSIASRGAKRQTCVNGWQQPAPGTDLYKQATAALEQSQGGTGYAVKMVRYFAGPVPAGGVGASYYLDVRDKRLSARVLLVSGAGPVEAAVAKTGTTGWKDGDWTGFRGDQPPAAHPPLPGRWSGPEFDPVRGTRPLLAPAVAGCLDGT